MNDKIKVSVISDTSYPDNPSATLKVIEGDGKYFWTVDPCWSNAENIKFWDEIDEELFKSLIAFKNRKL